jgi:hypothetical protein
MCQALAQILNPSYLSSPGSVVLSLQLEQRQLACFSYCWMYCNAYFCQVHLLMFFYCLVVLDILRKWGRSEFHSGPKEIVHFAVICPLLHELLGLRQWSGNSTLVKAKSDTGCLLNESADEPAEPGRRAAEEPEICPCPQKNGSFWLRVRPAATREFAEKCNKSLPRDSASNRSLFEVVAASYVTVGSQAVQHSFCHRSPAPQGRCNNLKNHSTLQTGRI